MKVFYSIIIFLYLMVHVTKASAQNKDNDISMTGIGALKIGMSQTEIEKMLNHLELRMHCMSCLLFTSCTK